MKANSFFLSIVILTVLTSCSKMYLSSLEKLGIPKREVMVYRVEKARNAQQEAKQQFKSALAQFTAVTRFSGGDLEKTYHQLDNKYKASVDKAEEVHKRIQDIEDVSNALFNEWEDELQQYSSTSLRTQSQRQLVKTRNQYQQMMATMKRAEQKIEPVLAVFKDQVLYLKHNLNARAIASLKGELKSIQTDVSALIQAMETSIDEANAFIQTMQAPR